MDAERVNYPFAWPHQWAQIEAEPNWHTVDLSSMRFADINDADRSASIGDYRMVRSRPCLRKYRNIHASQPWSKSTRLARFMPTVGDSHCLA